MKYFIQRQLNEYGPYTLADLQRYVAQGSILLTDLTRSEGMTEWVPVSQVIGNIPVPVPATAIPPQPGAMYGGPMYGGPVYGGAPLSYGVQTMAPTYTPVPPDFHWALVLLIGVLTCGFFVSAWLIVEAAWIKKIKPRNNALFFIIFAICGVYIGTIIVGPYRLDPNPLGLVFLLAGVFLYYLGVFRMHSDLEDYYNSTEPVHLQLSGVMTFFFAVCYFQHHFSRIAQWKKSGVLQPQG